MGEVAEPGQHPEQGTLFATGSIQTSTTSTGFSLNTARITMPR